MDKFEVVSPYQPTGDQPTAIESIADGIESGLRHQVLLGVTGSGKTYTMAKIIERVNRPTLVLAHNKTLVGQLCNEFRELFPKKPRGVFRILLRLFPARSVYRSDGHLYRKGPRDKRRAG